MSNELNSSGDNRLQEEGGALPSVGSIVSRLRFRQVALLTALDEQGSLHKAAEVMHMTQPAATKALHEMEDALGVTLFDRSPRGIEATELGRCVIRYARLIQSDVANLREELQNMISGRGGRLSIGTIMGAAPFVTRALSRLREIQPEVSIEISEDTSARQLLLLDQGRIDLMIGRSSVSSQPNLYHYEMLRGEPMCIVSGIDHPLATAQKVRLQELAGASWILYSSNMPMRIWIEHEFKLEGVKVPGNVIETASPFVTITLLAQSNMVAVMPLDIAHFFAARQMLGILPVNLKTRIEHYGIVTRKNSTLSSLAKMFIQILRQQN
ncbi:LysR family transcriptional regulator [Herbaspirillum rubrisubalbicans]|jgi:DNA-binding transcriptional LysR family regulator|uniref:LysR family transcriptional regulator n=2 Tax=Herbaspirillum rubrisubalbicans TaxID=80842 RepID=A0ABX9C1C9_9BURK|nr:LysR family transcriptional regulator [Herbaspirillum rubrisubalbicans]ALU90992.1 LysR family transcription regulator protein [Herbaspirillum rubrisubalbicans M1]MCP1574381.1 DNA-binding transcriptional LysR family regulator [Herbaspirillum rubrisubalbicans]NQE49606.1 LysR family transcriptional regulator [Herbaspirillum rubrisubalbicans]QJQ02863.1 LysR family transcriptional regulator [Herbaspirillum rubrisubalbicans Os34]RAM64091.1 LysR family transcriptional regulator [Herbaspirillum rub